MHQNNPLSMLPAMIWESTQTLELNKKDGRVQSCLPDHGMANLLRFVTDEEHFYFRKGRAAQQCAFLLDTQGAHDEEYSPVHVPVSQRQRGNSRSPLWHTASKKNMTSGTFSHAVLALQSKSW